MRIDGLAVQFTVVYYRTVEGREPIRDFLDRLRSSQPILHDLLAAGLEKLADSANHHRPLTELVDRKDRIWEVRVGRTNIAHIFWCFGQERREIVDLRGYVKHGQALDRDELDRARAYKHDLERRTP